MERKDFLEETDFKDDRPITRGELVRLFDKVRASAKVEERRMAWDASDDGVRWRAIAEAKADLMSDVIQLLKEE